MTATPRVRLNTRSGDPAGRLDWQWAGSWRAAAGFARFPALDCRSPRKGPLGAGRAWRSLRRKFGPGVLASRLRLRRQLAAGVTVGLAAGCMDQDAIRLGAEAGAACGTWIGPYPGCGIPPINLIEEILA